MDALEKASKEELETVDDIGEKIAISIQNFFAEEKNKKLIQRLKNAGVQMEVGEEEKPLSNALEGKTFLFTGTLTQFTRDEAQKMVEQNGGRNISAVSKNLNYLIAGEKAGSKLKKAHELGTVEILTEDEFLKMIEN